MNSKYFICKGLILLLLIFLLTGCLGNKESVDIEHKPESIAEQMNNRAYTSSYASETIIGAGNKNMIIEEKLDKNLVNMRIRYKIEDINISDDQGSSLIGYLVETITKTMAFIVMQAGVNFEMDLEPVAFQIPNDLDLSIFKKIKINEIKFFVANPKEENKNFSYNMKFLKSVKIHLSNNEIESDFKKRRIKLLSYKRPIRKKNLQEISFVFNQKINILEVLKSNEEILLFPSIKFDGTPKDGLIAGGWIDFTVAFELPF